MVLCQWKLNTEKVMDGFEGKTAGRHGLEYPWGKQTPQVGETLLVAPGVHWVRMPLPFSLKWINLWLLEDDDGWTIVDTGIPSSETKNAWRKIVEDICEGKPIKRTIVTHMHPDHIGCAGWLHRKFGTELWITRLEYVTCRMLVADTGREAPEAGTEFFRKAGWSEEQIENYRQRFGGFGRGVSQMPDSYRRLQDGDVFEIGNNIWRVITGCGHSPEHACLFCETLNIVISGDQLLPKISSNVSVHPTEPEANPLNDWLESCQKLIDNLPKDVLVLPAHNEPFRGAHARLQHLIDGHEVALKRLQSRLKERPRKVVEVFPAIFGRKIDDDLISMATGEAIAHLNCLRERGLAVRDVGQDGVHIYDAV